MLNNTEFISISEFIRLLLALATLVVSNGAYILYSNRESKNNYISILKLDTYIKSAFKSVNYIKICKIVMSGALSGFILVGIIYANLGGRIIIKFLQFIYQNDFYYKSYLLLNMDPTVQINYTFIIGSYLNILIVFLFFSAVILFRLRHVPSITQNMDFIDLDGKSYRQLWALFLVIGSVIGTNYIIYQFLYDIIANNIKILDFNLSLNYVSELYVSIKEILPTQWDIIFLIYVFGMLLSITSLILGYIQAKLIFSEWKKQIINHYSDNFPYTYIIVTSGIIYGKIDDVFGKNLILLNENGIIKAVLWKTIEAIEMESLNVIQDYTKYDSKYIW